MTAYRIWTLTCDKCGEIFDNGVQDTLVRVRASARVLGWTTGRTQYASDYCCLKQTPESETSP